MADDSGTRGALDRESLAAALSACVALLKGLEWSGSLIETTCGELDGEASACPACGNENPDSEWKSVEGTRGHDEGCELVTVLGAAEQALLHHGGAS